MPIELQENEHGGTTYVVPPGESLADLPAEVVRHVDAFDREVFRDPNAYAADLADSCRHWPLRCWLQTLSSSYFFRLLVHCADLDFGAEPVELRSVYFQFYERRLNRLFDVQFQKKPGFEAIHPAIQPVFDRVHLIDPSTWGIAGGQLTYDPSESGLFANMGWIDEKDQAEALRIRHLYTAYSGDAIGCRDDGMAVLCDHGRLEAIGPVTDFLDLYFEVLLARDDETHGQIAYAEKLAAILKQRRSAA